MRLLLSYSSSSSPALPPRTALLCNGISLCFPLFALGWVLQWFFVLPFPGHFPSCREPWGIPTGWSRGTDPLRVAGSIGPRGLLASPGEPLRFSSVGGTRQMLLAAGMIFGASAEITAHSLLMPGRQLRDALCSLLLPSIPSKILIQTGA